MITKLLANNFRSWRSTGSIRLAPLTTFFGTNSSGKSSLLKILLLLKQTVESQDRNRVLEYGDYTSYQSYADLGAYIDVVSEHKVESPISIDLSWDIPQHLKIEDPETPNKIVFEISSLSFSVQFMDQGGSTLVNQFNYSFDGNEFGMSASSPDFKKYQLNLGSYPAKKSPGRPWPLPPPIKCYGFPSGAISYYQNIDFLSDFSLAFERLFTDMGYLGPMRDEPIRTYIWAGDRPKGVGVRGEYTIPALLAARAEKMMVSTGRGHPKLSLADTAQSWLHKMGLLEDFSIRPIGRYRKEYEVQVKTGEHSPFVNISDVGFGLSQVLPIIVACFYAPVGSTLLIEQPENHLHPQAQAVLADLFIAATKDRKLQLIVESHSEHFLRRLQRRIAENRFQPELAAMYFCKRTDQLSEIEELKIDEFGYISNWPDGFFGNEIGEIAEMNKAALERKIAADG
jgi:predicted ATPase